VSQPPVLASAAASRHYRRRSASGGRLIGNSGNALIEFALVAPILVLLLLNLFDFSSLIWSRMQTDYAAQMGAQAALKTCAGGALPAMTSGNCSGLNTAIANAIHGTSLGSGVSLASGYPTETYYCVSGTALQSVGTYSSPPSPFDCSAAGNSAVVPGDYVTVEVSYSYTPTFTGLSLASSQTLTSTALERLQ
jgi:Flp pilus assembly protein TadG